MNTCKSYLNTFEKYRIAKILLQTHNQESDSFFKNFFMISTVDKSRFSDEEKYIDSISIEDLAHSIQQDIERAKEAKNLGRTKNDKVNFLLYLPEDRSYQQLIEGLNNYSKVIKKSVQFTYFGKVSNTDMYPYFTNEVTGDQGNIKHTGNPNAKTLVVSNNQIKVVDSSVQFACMPPNIDYIYVPLYEIVSEYNPLDGLYYQKTKFLSQSEVKQRVIFKRGKRPRIRYIRIRGTSKLEKHNPDPRFSSQE